VGDDVLSLYRDPHPVVLAKVMPNVDAGSASFLAASPFMVLATTSASGTDASPRGGPPGFVRVLDEGHVAWADLSGNNRLDSHRNIVEQPEVGLLFFVPGLQDMLRINGRASLTTDAAALDATTVDGVRPNVAVVVEVRECYLHCAKALRRSDLWSPTSWLPADALPRPAAIVGRHLQLDVDPEVIEQDLEAGYAVTLWAPAACED
jgi:PPOX class probable FMN-dependent enzyme